MPEHRIVPTRTNLMRARQDLALATEGHRLLDQKREVLIMELLERLSRLREQTARAREALDRAYRSLDDAELAMGADAFEAAALGPVQELSVSAVERSVMGVAIPTITAEGDARGPEGGLAGTVPELDQGRAAIHEAAPEILEWAELHLAVYRLAAEVRKTQRRVSALSEIFIPETREAIRVIAGALEEMEREEFFRRKRVKSKLAAREGRPRHERSGGEAA